MREACARRGRSFDDITLALFFPPMDEAKVRAQIALGYPHLIFGLPSEPRDKVLPVLDQVTALVTALRA